MAVAPEPQIPPRSLPARFHVETLGCPKNAVDSDKVVASLQADGLVRAESAEDADLVVVNTCAFIEAAGQESIDVTLELAERRKPGAKLVVTGCLAERYGDELAEALPEADAVVGFGERASWPRSSSGARRPGSVTCSSSHGRRRRRRGPTSRSPKGATGRAPSARSRASVASSAHVSRRRSKPRCGRSSTAERRRSCSWPRTSPGTAAMPVRRARSHRCCAASTSSPPAASSACGRSTCIPARSVTRWWRRCSSWRRSFPTSTSPSSTRRRRCCGACGGGEAVSGSWVSSTGSAPPNPTLPSGRRSSWGSRGRRKATTRSSWRSWPRPSSTGPGSSPIRARTGPPPTAWTASSPMTSRTSACARPSRCRIRSPGAALRRSSTPSSTYSWIGSTTTGPRR